MGERDGRADDRAVGHLRRRAEHERAVDLELRGGERTQGRRAMSARRRSRRSRWGRRGGSEGAEDPTRELGVRHRAGLRDLDPEAGRIEPHPGQSCRDAGDEFRVPQVRRGQVDGDSGAPACVLPLAALAQRFVDRPAGDWPEEPALLRQRDELARIERSPSPLRPPRERLDVVDLAARRVDDRLIDQASPPSRTAWRSPAICSIRPGLLGSSSAS